MKPGLIIPLLVMAAIFTADIKADNRVKKNMHRAMILDLSSRNKTGSTELLALKHCFDIFAIQYTITENIDDAADAPLVYTAGDLRNTTFTPDELNKLYSYVENGGVLVSQVITGNKLFPLFGIKDAVDSKKRFRIDFRDSRTDKSLHYLDRPEERTVPLGNKKKYNEVIWTHSYTVTEAEVLASTEDNKSIFSVNRYGDGQAYALGVSLSETVLLPHVGNDYEAQRGWINTFEPGSDVFLLIMKALYEEYTTPYIYLSTIPYGRDKVLILSHDVDAQSAFANMIQYAELEKKFGFNSTFFITTKYFKDEMDIGYYDAMRIEYIKQVKGMGGDIGSHTVSHSLNLDKFPEGSFDTAKSTYNAMKYPTVFGELKVSKEILDGDIPSQNTIAYRSGYLRYPYNMIDVLEKCGYRYDSTFSANDIMTNYAYRAFRFRKVGSEESSIIEIPVIFDDSQGLLTPKNMNELVNRWIDIIDANGDNEAVSVLLIHPSETGHKIKAEEKLLTSLSGDSIWVGSITAYGDFWDSRSKYKYESAIDGDVLWIKILNTSIDERISIAVKHISGIREIRVKDFKDHEIKYTRTDKGEKIFLNFYSR